MYFSYQVLQFTLYISLSVHPSLIHSRRRLLLPLPRLLSWVFHMRIYLFTHSSTQRPRETERNGMGNRLSCWFVYVLYTPHGRLRFTRCQSEILKLRGRSLHCILSTPDPAWATSASRPIFSLQNFFYALKVSSYLVTWKGLLIFQIDACWITRYLGLMG